MISFFRNSGADAVPAAADAEPAAAASDSNAAVHPSRARSAATALVPLCYVLGAVLLTWRLWANPAVRLVAGNPHDADQFAWFMQYAATAVRHGHLPDLITTGLNAPTGINIMWNTSLLLPDVVLAPVTWTFGPQFSLTILSTAGFAGSATALFWVLRRWNVSVAAAALAGAVYGFSPALLQSALAHYNLELAILPPLIIHAGLRLAVGPAVPSSRSADDPPVRWPARWLARVPAWVPAGAWLGLLITGQLFISEELALTTALAGVLVVLVLVVSRPRTALQRVLPTAAGLAIAVLVALALTGSALWTQFRGPLTEHGSAYVPTFYVNDLTNFVTPQSALLFHTAASAAAAARYQAGATEYLGYLGWPLIAALAVAAVVSWRRLAGRAASVSFVVLCVFSLGSHLVFAGRSHPGFGLPWQSLQVIPLFNAVLPDRLSILADGFAAALLAVAIDEARALVVVRRPSWRPPARLVPGAVLAVAVACCLPLLPQALPETRAAPLPAGWSDIFAQLHLGPGSRVLVLPIPRTGVTLAMRWAAESAEPSSMVGGYFIGPGIGGAAHLGGIQPNRKSMYLNLLWAEGVPPDSPYASAAAVAIGEWAVSPGRLGGAPEPNNWPVMHPMAALAQLAIWQPQAVIADATATSPLGLYLAKILGPPQVSVDDLIGWRLAAVPYTMAAASRSGKPAFALPGNCGRLPLKMPACASVSGRHRHSHGMTFTNS